MSDSAPAKPSRKGRWKGVIAAIAVLSLAAFGASIYWFGYPVSLSSFGHPLADRVTTLENSLDARVDARVQSQLDALGLTSDEWVSRTQWAQAQADTEEQQTQTAQQIADLQAAIDELVLAQQASRVSSQQWVELSDAVNMLSSRVDALSRDGLARAESVPITQVGIEWAQEQLALVRAWMALSAAAMQIDLGHQDAALEAYQEAELALAPLNGEELVSIKQSLAQEQGVLSEWAALDWGAWQERVMDALGSADPRVSPSLASSDSEPLTDEPDLGVWARVKQAMSQLVTVRPRASDEALTPADGMMFETALRYQWMQLEVAMLSRDVDKVQVQAKRIQAWLARSMPRQDARHGSLTELVDQLSQLNAPNPPAELGQTARAIQDRLQ